MKNEEFYSLKDFELSLKTDAKSRAHEFQKYIDQMNGYS